MLITSNNKIAVLLFLLPSSLNLAAADSPTTGYTLSSCADPSCKGTQTVFDKNQNGDGKCHNIPTNNNNGSIAVDAHNWCVNLYSEPDCKGAHLVAQADEGACSKINVAGKTFGGPGTDVPEWTVKSYIADDGNAKLSGTLFVPSTKIPAAAWSSCPSCNSCCPNDGFGAKRLLRRGIE